MKKIKKVINMVLSEAQARLRTVYFTLTGIIDYIKGLMGIIALLVLLSGHLNAFSLFDGLYKKIDDNSQKTYQLANEVSAVKNMNNTLLGKVDNMHFDLKAQLNAQAQAQVAAIAGVNNRINSTANTIGGDQKNTTINESAIFIRYVESQEKLAKTYEYIIGLLIIQLCVLLRMFIKGNTDTITMLIKLISEDAERDDSKTGIVQRIKNKFKKGVI